ncbi:BMT2 [Candida pseudojiufengensis]|uniref:BMT2 n=1 Tax=Candida pseudojiufengensis TaxID=497109 RepID=UPI002225422C|nr:BMT2 [Candida pseudojiufengensis]KAI5963328.1 BMT2 [Candida pseudojiufengensis]
MAKKKVKKSLSSITNDKNRNIINPKSLKPQQTRQIIRRFHVLQKNKHSIITKLQKSNTSIDLDNYDDIKQNKIYQVEFNNFKIAKKHANNEIYKIDVTLNEIELIKILAKIDSEIEQRGGIKIYQSASNQGQTNKRGGDSSKKLIEWLKTSKYETKLKEDLNALEIGCLSPYNNISTSKIFKSIIRIDLNSQDPLILQQNFMERPLPTTENEKFNLISCSLVLNFVPSHEKRGEMLIRITKFLKSPNKGKLSSLFLVLPLPCIKNSRYFDNDKLLEIMNSLGFKQNYIYEAKKVAYWLFDWNGKVSKNIKFNKKELHSGSTRNNFCITIN